MLDWRSFAYPPLRVVTEDDEREHARTMRALAGWTVVDEAVDLTAEQLRDLVDRAMRMR